MSSNSRTPDIDWKKMLVSPRPDYEALIEQRRDWVLLRRDKVEKTAGGLHIPEAAKAAMAKLGNCTVVAVGPGHWNEGGFNEMTLKVGDRVMTDPQAPCYSMPQDELIMLIREEHILATVRPSGEPVAE